MRTFKTFTVLLLTSLLSSSLTACANTPTNGNQQNTSTGENNTDKKQTTEPATASGQEPDSESSSYHYGSSQSGSGRWWRNSRITKYTQADYDLAVSFCVDGYQNKTVAEFDLSVMDWRDEDAYHKMEETLRRLHSSLPEDDKNAGFIYGTLSNTWEACEKKHYETCDREKHSWHNSFSEYETYGDVYGDRLLLAGAYANFDFDYTIADETAITVGERDAMLDSAAKELTQYMGKQPEEKLSDEDTMEKTLETELKKLLKTMGDGNLVWEGACSLSYWWDAPWEWYLEDYLPEDKNKEKDDEDGDKQPEGYTQEQYKEVLDRFKFDSYKEMSVAEFDRMVNDLTFSSDSKGDELFLQTYEIVCSYLDSEDPNADFFNQTIPTSLQEYKARACSVYSGKLCDPTYYDHINLERKEDVFGDQVLVDILNGDYTLTYRILDADKLTVGQRELFFDTVRKEAGELLLETIHKGEVTEKDFENAIMEAGKKAGNDLITLIKCEVEYVYKNDFM